MTKRSKFECDVTGELYGAKNAGDGVMDIEIRRHHESKFDVWNETVHISNDVLWDRTDGPIPTNIKYIGVENNGGSEEIVEVCCYLEDNLGGDIKRDYDQGENIVLNKYTSFFTLIEEEILY